MIVLRSTLSAERARAERAEDALTRAEAALATAEGLLHELLRGLVPPTPRGRTLDVPVPTVVAPSDVPGPSSAVTPAVLDACRIYAFGDARQESANRRHAYALARQGESEAAILRTIKVGEQVVA